MSAAPRSTILEHDLRLESLRPLLARACAVALLLGLGLGLSSSAAAQESSLETTYAGGNGQAGNMFDVYAADDIIVTRVDAHIDVGTWTVAVYFSPDGYAGKTESLDGWNPLGSVVVTGGGDVATGGQPTPIPLPLMVPIAAGKTTGFYVVVTDGSAINYSNGTVEGAAFASDGQVTIFEGVGTGWPPQFSFAPRVWNGTLYYLQDCNGNGVEDSLDVLLGTSADCNGNGVPDECDLESGTSYDIDGDGQLDDCVAPLLMADRYSLSVSAGGAQVFTLTAPYPNALYLLLGSASGTQPGTSIGALSLPLNPDAYLRHTRVNPNQFPLTNSLGLLAPTSSGATATAIFALPPASPAVVGQSVHHAYVAYDFLVSGTTIVSNPVPLEFLP